MMPGWTGPFECQPALPALDADAQDAAPLSELLVTGVEQRIFLQPAAQERRRACRHDGRSRFLGRLEPQLDLAFDRRRSVHEISRSMAFATPKACPAILTEQLQAPDYTETIAALHSRLHHERDRPPATRLSLRQPATLETPPCNPFDAFCEADYLHRAPQPARCNQRSPREPPPDRGHVAAGR